jgi:cell division protein FtsI (penicillin-binding protein 3)
MSNKKFVWIKRNITPKEQYAVNNLGIPGLSFEETTKRVYPHNHLFSHILGYVGVDKNGLAGVEQYLNNMLATQNNDDNSPLSLSLDVRVQHILHNKLTSAMEEFSAIGAAGIIASIDSGEIISMVSLPDFNPHHPGEADPNALFNRASLGTNEVGSIFKTVTVAMALEKKKVSLETSYDVSNPIQIAKFQLHDYHRHQGHYSVTEIFMHSSNIGTAKIAMDVGVKEQQNFLKKMGLLDAVELEISERGTPQYPSKDRWNNLSLMTIAYGHGIAVTQLHMIKAISSLINGGFLLPLTVLKKDVDKLEEREKIRVVSQETSDNMRKLLRLVVAKGTGKKAAAPGYLVGGKTGTAEKITNGRYNKNQRVSYFVGAFPMNAPKYIILIMLDEPKGTKKTAGFATGGWTAAPVAGSVISEIASILGVLPVDETSPDIRNNLWLDYYANIQNSSL